MSSCISPDKMRYFDRIQAENIRKLQKERIEKMRPSLRTQNRRRTFKGPNKKRYLKTIRNIEINFGNQVLVNKMFWVIDSSGPYVEKTPADHPVTLNYSNRLKVVKKIHKDNLTLLDRLINAVPVYCPLKVGTIYHGRKIVDRATKSPEANIKLDESHIINTDAPAVESPPVQDASLQFLVRPPSRRPGSRLSRGRSSQDSESAKTDGFDASTILLEPKITDILPTLADHARAIKSLELRIWSITSTLTQQIRILTGEIVRSAAVYKSIDSDILIEVDMKAESCKRHIILLHTSPGKCMTNKLNALGEILCTGSSPETVLSVGSCLAYSLIGSEVEQILTVMDCYNKGSSNAKKFKLIQEKLKEEKDKFWLSVLQSLMILNKNCVNETLVLTETCQGDQAEGQAAAKSPIKTRIKIKTEKAHVDDDDIAIGKQDLKCYQVQPFIPMPPCRKPSSAVYSKRRTKPGTSPTEDVLLAT